MKKKAILLVVSLLFCTVAHALTPTPTPLPSPTPGIGIVSQCAAVKAYYDGEWHALMQEMVWQQIATPNGYIFTDGLLHFMPLNEYVKGRDIPEAASPEGFEYQVMRGESSEPVSSTLTVLRQDGDSLQRIEELPERWEDLEPGRYLFSITYTISSDESGGCYTSLLWVNR